MRLLLHGPRGKRQPTYAFERISCPMCSGSSHLESGTLFPLSLFLAVIVPGVWVLLRSTENWFLLEMSISVGAMLGLTVDSCSASVLWWLSDVFSTLRRSRILKCCSPPTAEWRSVPPMFLVAVLHCAVRTWKSFLRASRGRDA